MDVVIRKRAHSSFSTESKTASILAKSFMIRDDIKHKILHQRQIDSTIFREYKKDLEKRSVKRFSRSPFLVNVIADNEIQEHNRKLNARTRKCASMSKNLKRGKETTSYLTKLRVEIRKMNDREKSIGSRMKAQITNEKLARARKDRLKMKRDKGLSKCTDEDVEEEFDTFWADCEE